ncbi:ectoine hydroxylase [Bradyrhizobium sp. USDA 4516]
MQLVRKQIEAYHRDGFLEVLDMFSTDEVETLRAAYARDCQNEGPYVIRESDGSRIRAIYASNLRQPEFDILIKSGRFLGCAKQLVDYDLYLYQFKINSKSPLGGESWVWHYDFSVWHAVDQLPKPNQVNIALCLDDLTEFNGPLIFISGSHLAFGSSIDVDGSKESAHVDPLAYAPATGEMQRLLNDHKMVSPKCPAGSVIFFNSKVIHGSSINMSPFPRRLLIVTYNDVDNVPKRDKPRSEYIIRPATPPLAVDDRPLV